MNYNKIKNIENRLTENRKKLNGEDDEGKRKLLRIQISIDELKIKFERLKD